MRKLSLLVLFVFLTGCTPVVEEYSSIDSNKNDIIELGEVLLIDDYAITFISTEVVTHEKFGDEETGDVIKVNLHLRNLFGENTNFWISPNALKVYKQLSYIKYFSPTGDSLKPIPFNEFYFPRRLQYTGGQFSEIFVSYQGDGDYELLFDDTYKVSLPVDAEKAQVPSSLERKYIDMNFENKKENIINPGETMEIVFFDVSFDEISISENIELGIVIYNREQTAMKFSLDQLDFFNSEGVEVFPNFAKGSTRYIYDSFVLEIPPLSSIEAIIYWHNEGEGEYSVVYGKEFDNDGYTKYSFVVE